MQTTTHNVQLPTKKKSFSISSGFTLIEMIVSIGIFTIVMLMATSAIFTVVAANQKAQSLKIVMDNLDFALDSMVREIRVGSEYTCPPSTCSTSGNTQFSFTPNTSTVGDPQTIEYYLSGNQIMESNSAWNDGAPLSITASGITVTSLEFYVIQSSTIQPRVLITITGTSGSGSNLSTFNIQTTVSERQLQSS